MGHASNNNTKRNNNSAQGKFTWRSNEADEAQVSWSDIPAEDLRFCIDTLTRSGNAVILGLTGDGGAYSVTLLAGDDKVKEYPHTVEECLALLRALADHYLPL